MGKGFNIPWKGVRYAKGRGFDMPWIESSIYLGKWVRYTMDKGQYTIGRVLDIPWVGGSQYHG